MFRATRTAWRGDREIEEGAGRPARELIADLADSAQRLEDVWERCAAAGWPHPDFHGDDHWPPSGSPLRRLREVEVHHVDLGLGYEPADWPDLYVTWELPNALRRLPDRLSAPDSRHLLAWLTGRADLPTDLNPGPWM